MTSTLEPARTAPADLADRLAALARESVQELTPHSEGTNIGSWIGFKHVGYLLEEAVLAHLRDAGLGARHLYDEHGLCVEVVDTDLRILHGMHLDDRVRVRVRPTVPDAGPLRFALVAAVRDADGRERRLATGTLEVVLRREDWTGEAAAVPPELAPHAVDRIGAADPDPAVTADGTLVDSAAPGADPLAERLLAGRNGVVWRRRVPYFYCHWNERLSQTGHLRLVEEVVDLFLARRGISVRDLLARRRWIPAVPRARVRAVGEALMEEEIAVVLTVDEVFKNLVFHADVAVHVLRDGVPVPVATGRITHGYAEVAGRREWGLVELDDAVVAALGGTGAVPVRAGEPR